VADMFTAFGTDHSYTQKYLLQCSEIVAALLQPVLVARRSMAWLTTPCTILWTGAARP
jgi:hypothetical protein